MREAQRRRERSSGMVGGGRDASITSVVEQLPNVPAEHVRAVMGRRLALPATDPHVHHEDVHRSLLAHRELASGLDASAPAVVASAGRLVGMDHDETACALELCPAADRSPLAGVVAYLRDVLREEPTFPGLRPTRVYADACSCACYYKGDAAATPRRQSQWDYPSLELALRAGRKDGDAKYLNDSRSAGYSQDCGIAFWKVVRRLRGADAARGLSDLNARRTAGIALSRTLASCPVLPSADWADGDGRRYAVKCNLFYRSKQAKVGLQGFLIELKQPSDRHCSYPAFVFTDTAMRLPVGLRRGLPAGRGGEEPRQSTRPSVLLPPPRRAAVHPAEHEMRPRRGHATPTDRFLRLGWQLAVGLRAVPRQEAARPRSHSWMTSSSCVCGGEGPPSSKRSGGH